MFKIQPSIGVTFILPEPVTYHEGGKKTIIDIGQSKITFQLYTKKKPPKENNLSTKDKRLGPKCVQASLYCYLLPSHAYQQLNMIWG